MTTFGWSSARRQARLADEALGERRVVALEVEPLEHDLAVEGRLADEVDDSHPAAGEHPDDLVAADPLTVQGPSGSTLRSFRARSQGPEIRVRVGAVRVLPPALRSVSPRELAQRIDAERRGLPFLVHLDDDGRQRIVALGDLAR